LSARIDRETGAATDRSPIFWDANHSFPSARGRARGRHTRVSTGVRDSKGRGAKASVDVARARRWKRGQARAETVGFGRARRRFRARGTSASRGE
jgi:hypothetical protein